MLLYSEKEPENLEESNAYMQIFAQIVTQVQDETGDLRVVRVQLNCAVMKRDITVRDTYSVCKKLLLFGQMLKYSKIFAPKLPK